jgi:hypothetical protein
MTDSIADHYILASKQLRKDEGHLPNLYRLRKPPRSPLKLFQKTILLSTIRTVQMGLRESGEAQPPETIARRKFVIDKKTSLHKEQRQQASEMLDLKGDAEMVR